MFLKSVRSDRKTKLNYVALSRGAAKFLNISNVHIPTNLLIFFFLVL